MFAKVKQCLFMILLILLSACKSKGSKISASNGTGTGDSIGSAKTGSLSGINVKGASVSWFSSRPVCNAVDTTIPPDMYIAPNDGSPLLPGICPARNDGNGNPITTQAQAIAYDDCTTNGECPQDPNTLAPDCSSATGYAAACGATVYLTDPSSGNQVKAYIGSFCPRYHILNLEQTPNDCAGDHVHIDMSDTVFNALFKVNITSIPTAQDVWSYAGPGKGALINVSTSQ